MIILILRSVYLKAFNTVCLLGWSMMLRCPMKHSAHWETLEHSHCLKDISEVYYITSSVTGYCRVMSNNPFSLALTSLWWSQCCQYYCIFSNIIRLFVYLYYSFLILYDFDLIWFTFVVYAAWQELQVYISPFYFWWFLSVCLAPIIFFLHTYICKSID